MSYGRRRRRRSLNDTTTVLEAMEEDEEDENDVLMTESNDLGAVGVSTDGTWETTFTFNLDPMQTKSG